MRPLTAAEVLDAWERGQQQSPVEWAIGLLAAADPATPAAEIAAWPMGQRDGRLLQLWESTFGREVGGLATCPACGALSDITLDVDSLRLPETDPPTVLSVSVDGYDAEFRLLNSLDLLELADHPSPAPAEWLLRRSVLAVRRNGVVGDAGELPGPVRDAIVATMASHDAQADLQLDLCCPSCGHRWTAGFDIAAFLGHEVATWADRALREVDVLARAYGWSQESILALSARRRQRYLELVEA